MTTTFIGQWEHHELNSHKFNIFAFSYMWQQQVTTWSKCVGTETTCIFPHHICHCHYLTCVSTSEGFRAHLMESVQEGSSKHWGLVFGAWDYSLTSPATAKEKRRSICNEILVCTVTLTSSCVSRLLLVNAWPCGLISHVTAANISLATGCGDTVFSLTITWREGDNTRRSHSITHESLLMLGHQDAHLISQHLFPLQ